MKFRSTAMIVAFTGAVVVLAHGQAAQQQPRPQMAEEVFKNVQVLKGIPVDEFMDTMGMFSAALSLNCIDCHTAESVGTWDRFADETPLKQTARRMVQMVNEINRVSFKGVRSVTCYTCHHGDLRPKMVPNLAAQYATPVEDPNEIEVFRLPGGPSADQVFEKYLQALGGPQRLGALTSFAGKGTYIGFETEQTKVPVEVFAKAPLQRSTVVHMTVGDKVTLYDGRAAWIARSDKPIPLMSLTGRNLDGAKIDALVAFPAQIKQAFSQWQVGATAIDDREVQVLPEPIHGRLL